MARHKRESTEILTRNEVSRREFLQIAGAAAGLALLPRVAAANTRVIRAEPALATLVGGAYPQTAVWTYGRTVPGTELRFKQGERLRVELRAGERIRLRLVNAANARIFALEFRGHEPVVIALDGHPVEPHRAEQGRIVLGPAMRADVLLDAKGEPGRSYAVVDDFYPRRAYRLLDLRYAKEPLR